MTMPVTLEYDSLITALPTRAPNSHKGNYGHVVIVGGDYGYPGAPVLAGLGALRVGAGLVTIASHKEHLIGLNATHPELMCHAIDKIKLLSELLNKATVIVLGPGLGRTNWSEKIFKTVIKTNVPIVLDADGLFFLAQNPTKNLQRVITPHAREAANLLQAKTIALSDDEREISIKKLIDKYASTVILKGAKTLVASKSHPIGVCKQGNPGMASGGMGDLLSGMIGGLIAQDLALDTAAKLAVCIHAMAGDIAAKNGQRGIIATDLLMPIKQLTK